MQDLLENATRVVGYDQTEPVKVRMRPRPTCHTQNFYKFKRVVGCINEDDLSVVHQHQMVFSN